MKRVLLVISLIFSAVFFSSATPAHAGTLCPGGQYANLCNLKLEQGSTIVGTIITVLIILAMILSIIFLIWGGIRWIMSGGDTAKVQSARSTIIAAIIGLVIALLSFAIVSVITFIVTGQSFGALSIPTLY
jgi:uncharacterized protein YacL